MMKHDDVPQHVVPGTEHIYIQYLASNALEEHEPDFGDTFSTEEQKVMKRKIRTMLVANWDYIYSQMVYPKSEDHDTRVSYILDEHKIQICFYDNGKVRVQHNLKEPNRKGLIFRLTEDQTWQPEYFHESSMITYFESILSDWYGKDLAQNIYSLTITRDYYLEHGLVDVTKDDIDNGNFVQPTLYNKIVDTLSKFW
jgi:hypothetical protein